MDDPLTEALDVVTEAMRLALNIARDAAQKPAHRLQAVGAVTRAASALATISEAQHARQERDLHWASRAIERPVGLLPGPSGAQVEELRLSRVSRILEAHALGPPIPDW